MISNHKGLYLEIDIIQDLRNPFIDLAQTQNRLLSSTRPNKVSQYKQALIEYISSRNAIEKSNEIQNKINNKSLIESNMKERNNLDIVITKGALFSQKK